MHNTVTSGARQLVYGVVSPFSDSREVLTIALNGMIRKRPTLLDTGTMQDISYFAEKVRGDDQNVLFALLDVA